MPQYKRDGRPIFSHHCSSPLVNMMRLLISSMLVFMMFGFVRCEIGKDREECTNQLIGLSTCLAYVGGSAKAPTPDCCTSMKQVLAKSKKCLCILVRDRDDPTLGLKINATLALGIPSICKSSASVGDCPALLHLAPNSPEAKVFQQFDKSLHAVTPASTGNSSSSGSSAAVKSAGEMKKSWFQMNVVGGILLLSFTSLLVMGF